MYSVYLLWSVYGTPDFRGRVVAEKRHDIIEFLYNKNGQMSLSESVWIVPGTLGRDENPTP